ncbi:MAG: MATE family efflux transporter [Bryobacteraceae bacterium]|nr:MATE family efflux transporter [Bryobacteraceae bacterium]
MLSLAGPVVLAELAWVGMAVVDTVMVGRVGAGAIGAVGLGSILFYSIGIFGMGLLLGLDTLVSQAFGAGRLEECNRSLLHGVYLSFLVAPVLMGLVWLMIPCLPALDIHAHVLPEAVAYLKAVTWSTLPLLLYAAFRRYLQAMNQVRVVMFALISANLINALVNWMLIYGNLGAPKLGVVGAGWATCLSRVYMAGVLIVAAILHDRRAHMGLFRISLRPDIRIFRRLMSLGLPASLQMTLEVGVFGAATALAARTNPVSLAAHQIVLNIATVTFMVPLGIASAAAVRVGQAVGRRDPAGSRRAGWTSLLLGASFMAMAGLSFFLFPRHWLQIFTADRTVITMGMSILMIAALFQLFDGLQVVATGALRGFGDTRTPMLTNLFGHWAIGLPAGYALGFAGGWGIRGLWIGLSLGLIVVGCVLLGVWARRSKEALREAVQPVTTFH